MEINYLAVLVCAIAALIIGWIWYGPFFKKQWMKIMGMENLTPEQMASMKKGMGGLMFAQLVMSAVSAYVFAYFMALLPMVSPMSLAFWVWLGFLMPTAAGAAIWSGKKRSLAWAMFLITAACELITFLVYAEILSVWH